MEYRKFNNTIVARIDKGEEILDKIKEIALKENIKLANINALGATNDFTVGVFKVDEKKYYANEFKGNFEIVSLTGTINTMNGLKRYSVVNFYVSLNEYGGVRLSTDNKEEAEVFAAAWNNNVEKEKYYVFENISLNND